MTICEVHLSGLSGDAMVIKLLRFRRDSRQIGTFLSITLQSDDTGETLPSSGVRTQFDEAPSCADSCALLDGMLLLLLLLLLGLHRILDFMNSEHVLATANICM